MEGREALHDSLFATFKLEATQRLQQLAQCLAEMEKHADPARQPALVEHVYREAHSLKGAACAVNLTEVEGICRTLEDLFLAAKKRQVVLTPALFGLLYRVCETLEDFVAATGTDRLGLAASLSSLALQLTSQMQASGSPEPASTEPPTQSVTERKISAPTAVPERARLATAKLDALLFAAEELTPTKTVARQRAAEAQALHKQFAEWQQDWARARPLLEAAASQTGERRQARLSEFVDHQQQRVLNLRAAVENLARSLEQDRRVLVPMVELLQHETKKARLLPAADVFGAYPRMVRALASEQGKDVAFELHGGDIEIDRSVLEMMKDPVLHLVRNCLDHGIEAPEIREQHGKPRRGVIRVSIQPRSGGTVTIEVSDDGAGIDVEKLTRVAKTMQLAEIKDRDALTREQALELIFVSGVTTSPMVTSLSGRGLGLSIVREKVEVLNGRLELETASTSGTTFRLILPVTMSTFRGVSVRAGGQTLVIPTVNVERVLRVRPGDIKTVENRQAISDGETVLSVTSLDGVLELAPHKHDRDPERIPVLILRASGTRMAFTVDAIVEEHEVLVKTLGRQLSRVRNVMGGAVLASGEVALVLNVADLLKSATHRLGRPVTPMSAAQEVAAKTILVAEDSITTRMLLKHVLQAAGYRVLVAADGVEAFTLLKSEATDLVVSDVEMPRLDGFGLAARIRADKQLAQLPLVLVTALESREDKARGIEVGANAYLVKSSFDQSDLLEVVRRLI